MPRARAPSRGRAARPAAHRHGHRLRRRVLAGVGRLAAGRLDRHALLARDGRGDHRVRRRRGRADLLDVQVPRPARRGRRPDPRQHAPGDRVDRRRRRHPRRARGGHVHPAAGHPRRPELRPQRPAARRPRPRRGRPDEEPAAERQVAEHLRQRPAVRVALHLRAGLQERPAELGLLLRADGRPDRHHGHARHRRAGRRALVVDPQARRQVRRRPGLHEQHVVQGAGGRDPAGGQAGHLPRPVRRAVRAQPREHDRPRDRHEARRLRGLAGPPAQRDQAGRRRRPAPAPARRPRPAARRLTPPPAENAETDTPRMATQEITAPAAVPQIVAHGVERERRGWTSWVTTTDHKRIGIMYLVLTFVFFLLGGTEALLMRLQLSQANNTLLTPQTYNQLLTMHGTTMIFLFVVPVMAGFGNYFLPLMIGARDMAFPKLNALSFWLLVAGGLVFYGSIFFSPPECGWAFYPPLSSSGYLPRGGGHAGVYLVHLTR